MLLCWRSCGGSRRRSPLAPKHQLGRRNLDTYPRGLAGLELGNRLRAIAARNLKAAGKEVGVKNLKHQPSPTLANADEPVRAIADRNMQAGGHATKGNLKQNRGSPMLANPGELVRVVVPSLRQHWRKLGSRCGWHGRGRYPQSRKHSTVPS